MNYDESQLWNKLEHYSISNPNDVLTFSKRLARENGWTEAFAKRVIKEYKKFLFLCVVSPQPVTPSDEVDQAWHLHLTYTKSYWTDLCKKILGKDIHHTPTEGGAAENKKFVNYYEATLLLYKQKFGKEAPADIWPTTGKRFGDIDFVRTNKQTHWVVKKARWSHNYTGILLILAGMAFAVVFHTAVALTISVIGILFLVPWSDNKTADPKQKGSDAHTCSGGCTNGGDSFSGHHGSHDNHGGHDSHSGCGGHSGGGGDGGCSSGCSGGD